MDQLFTLGNVPDRNEIFEITLCERSDDPRAPRTGASPHDPGGDVERTDDVCAHRCYESIEPRSPFASLTPRAKIIIGAAGSWRVMGDHTGLVRRRLANGLNKKPRTMPGLELLEKWCAISSVKLVREPRPNHVDGLVPCSASAVSPAGSGIGEDE